MWCLLSSRDPGNRNNRKVFGGGSDHAARGGFEFLKRQWVGVMGAAERIMAKIRRLRFIAGVLGFMPPGAYFDIDKQGRVFVSVSEAERLLFLLEEKHRHP
jgi:hypothetical protein